MKLHLAFVVILLIVIVKFHNSEAQDTSLDKLYDRMNKPKSDDNVINGNNNKDRVQVNGKELVNETAHDNKKDHDHKKNTTSNANVLNTAFWLNGCILAQLLYFLMRKCL
ncbi:uncharacterized protein LOC135952384 [Calliphora vicina]|uniref:uncharacterized protein LOC135952384 n=1 Tax=Calliphora vicina TaxID=7373 RepID=UPI00325B2AEA